MEFFRKNKKLLVIAIFIVAIFIAGSFAWLRLGYNGTAINKIKMKLIAVKKARPHWHSFYLHKLFYHLLHEFAIIIIIKFNKKRHKT